MCPLLWVYYTSRKFICNSRPRRFGKSFTANMLAAYYSKGCDSHELFSRFKLQKSTLFSRYINKFDVIQIDFQWFFKEEAIDNTLNFLTQTILAELREAYQDILPAAIQELPDALSYINNITGNKFVIIIDEWDMLIRSAPNDKKIQNRYIDFLRRLFKGMQPEKYIAFAYLTGILPVKKYKTQSALNNFEEYTMTDPGELAPYIGFTEAEVEALCKTYKQNFHEVKRWYDGYILNGWHVYNPKAVVKVMERGIFQSYWSMTGTYEAIVPLISMDFDGLKNDVLKMLSGTGVPVRTNTYQNDMSSFKNKNDIMTSLIHLGYLAYSQPEQQVYIPNEEIRNEFIDAVEETKWNEFLIFQKLSQSVIEATLARDCETLAELIEKIHRDYVSALAYNDENSLSSVISIAYLGAMHNYFKPLREMPAGYGFADLLYVPKPQYLQKYPALLIELKWNKDVHTALEQIKVKKYPEAVKEYTGEIWLVGINYDKKTKQHTCIIEKYEK